MATATTTIKTMPPVRFMLRGFSSFVSSSISRSRFAFRFYTTRDSNPPHPARGALHRGASVTMRRLWRDAAISGGRRNFLMDSFDKLKPVALLFLRCALGIIFISHGFPKLFTQTAQFMKFSQSVGLPASAVYAIGVLELFGGGMLIVGLGTRVVALLLAGEMAVVIWKARMVHGIYVVHDYEHELALATASFVLTAVGAGVLSLDHPLFGRRSTARPKPDKK
jgi:putative oxidoreductase